MEVLLGLNGLTMGSIPDWIVAFFTSIALIVATFTYRRDSRHRRLEQARKVYCSFVSLEAHDRGARVPILAHGAISGVGGGKYSEIGYYPGGGDYDEFKIPVMQAYIEIHNQSSELITEVDVRLFDRYQGISSSEFVVSAGPIGPNKSAVVGSLLANPNYPDQPGCMVEMRYTDSEGRRWARTLVGNVREVDRLLWIYREKDVDLLSPVERRSLLGREMRRKIDGDPLR